jgi:hypothetical protein
MLTGIRLSRGAGEALKILRGEAGVWSGCKGCRGELPGGW